MALNKLLIVVGLVLQWIGATLEVSMVLRPERQKTVGQGVIVDIREVLSKRERWVHGGALLLFLIGTVLQVFALFVGN